MNIHIFLHIITQSKMHAHIQKNAAFSSKRSVPFHYLYFDLFVNLNVEHLNGIDLNRLSILGSEVKSDGGQFAGIALSVGKVANQSGRSVIACSRHAEIIGFFRRILSYRIR